MKKSLADLASAFNKSKDDGNNQQWKLFFPFWKAPVDTTSIVRFLPDEDDTNMLAFLVENTTHELFINGKKEKVPCLKMYGKSCPVCAHANKLFEEHNDSDGKHYYRKRAYIGQVLVVETPIEHDKSQPIKLIEFGPAIYKVIQAAFGSGDFEEVPYAVEGGYNFRIKKSQNGDYPSYSTSSFSPKQTSVDARLAMELKPYNLKDFRQPEVSAAALEVMLLADISG